MVQRCGIHLLRGEPVQGGQRLELGPRGIGRVARRCLGLGGGAQLHEGGQIQPLLARQLLHVHGQGGSLGLHGQGLVVQGVNGVELAGLSQRQAQCGGTGQRGNESDPCQRMHGRGIIKIDSWQRLLNKGYRPN